MSTIAQIPTITFACGGCGRPFTVPTAFAGRRATCKNCGNKVVVPDGAEAETPAYSSDIIAPTNGKSHAAAPLVEAPARTPSVTMKIPEASPARTHRPDQISVISEAQTPPMASHLTITLNDTTPIPAPPPATPAPGIAEATTDRPAASGSAPRVPVRVRRLMVDAEQMAKTFAGEGSIRIKSALAIRPRFTRSNIT